MKRLVQIYRSGRKEEMYLYVDKSRDLQDVPEAFLAQFGEATPVMTLLLTPQRKLARARAAEVLERIENDGFYLQMPPTPEELLRREKADD